MVIEFFHNEGVTLQKFRYTNNTIIQNYQKNVTHVTWTRRLSVKLWNCTDELSQAKLGTS